MMTNEDYVRIVRGPADLEERIEQLEKQKELLKTACKKAGARIKELENSLSIALDINDKYQRDNKKLKERAQEAEGEMTIVKGIGMNSPEMREAKAEIERLKADLARAREDHQYDNLVHKKELEDLGKR
jgi:chromosome segregation ATPase